MRDRRLIRFTKLVLDVMFYTGFVIILTLPVSLKFLGKYYSVVISEYSCLCLRSLRLQGSSGY